jgi:uncharacterized phage-associated protein
MISALDIAKYFLTKSNKQDEDGEFISNLKLQKLLYYTQGYYLALNNEKLFPERIEAWAHGPVVPAVYYPFKEHGGKCIPVPEDFKVEVLSQDVRDFLDEVYLIVGQFSAWKLREMTHSESPWVNTWNQGAGVNSEITADALSEYFKPLVHKN